MLNRIELTAEQCKETINTFQLYQSYKERLLHLGHFKGSLSWKTIHGDDYLYKKEQGSYKCLGKRSEATESLYRQFYEGKEHAHEDVRSIFEQMKIQSRYAKAARVNRMPILPANIIRKIEKKGLSHQISVIGTHAIYAYESLASKYVVPSLMETSDIDFLWDKRMRLRIACNETAKDGVMHIIQSVDKSFKRTSSPYRAANKSGFMVDLVTGGHELRKNKLPSTVGSSGNDIEPAGIGSLKWLINSPSVVADVIDAQGMPLSVRVPDPRCFAVHKAWLSTQPNREKLKSLRDLEQAKVVAEMTVQDMSGFEFSNKELAMFPFDVKRQAEESLDLDFEP